ncbi:MAG TPA: ATP-binding protein, partial [Tepidisphaeraceae bacterium]|nr:ATP-binding protein [Tepidisphaeraceae bacterium]
MTIQKKLYLGFLGSTISVMVVGAFSIHSLSVTAGSLQEMIGTTLREVKETSRAAQSAVALDTKIDDFIDAVDHKRSAEALAAKQSIAMYFVVVSAAISGLRDEANEMLKIEDTQEEILEEKQHIARIDDLDSARGQLQHNWDEISAKVETNDKVDDELLRKNDIENHNLVSQALELQDGARGEISETLTDTAQSVSLQWFIVLVAGAGAVMLTATIALMTAGPLGRRLHEVRTKAGQVGGGDLAVRIDIKGKDEISDLARTFNHMAENLAASREQLVDAAARAEAANNAKSAFLANMSHEIRTPMTAIMGYAERLLEHKESFGEHAEALQIIQSSGGHLLDLINDILDISKIEANKLAVERAEMDLPQIAVDVISLLRAHAVARGVALHLSFSDFIPQTIRSDPLRVKQILMNIVGNALKFTEHGTVRLHIDCQASELSSLITMEVTDTGIGISKEQLERLFQPFAQADESTTRRFGGTGLGLTISKHLAQLLGGGLSVESIAGVGSSFKISIDGGSLAGVKMLSGLKESMLAKPRAETQSSPEIKLNCRILLVEDGPENQKLLSLH